MLTSFYQQLIRSIADRFALSPTPVPAYVRIQDDSPTALALNSYFWQPLRTFADHFVLLTTASYFCRRFRSFGDRFVPLATESRSFADPDSFFHRPIFVLLPPAQMPLSQQNQHIISLIPMG
jgi:hypothetical protein